MRRIVIPGLLLATGCAGHGVQLLPDEPTPAPAAAIEAVWVRSTGGYRAQVSLPEASWVTLVGAWRSGELTYVAHSRFNEGKFPAGRHLVGMGPQASVGREAVHSTCYAPTVPLSPSVPVGAHVTTEQASRATSAVAIESQTGGCTGFQRSRRQEPPRLFMLLTPERVTFSEVMIAFGNLPGELKGADAARSVARQLGATLVEEPEPK